MATYKVIQDIEAEDKLLGPLTLRQFIYALITAICGYFAFLLVSHGAGLLAPLFVLPGLFSAFFAFPWSREQPTEIWALAKLRFYLKTRKRIWDQSGVKELVTITVPKRVEQNLTNNLSQTEVRSRLQALANTIDSRGWAVKNVNVNLYTQPLRGAMAGPSSDRLIDMSSLPQEVPTYDVSAADDMLDETNNPVAQQFETMITTQAKNRRANLMAKMQQASQPQAVAPTTPAPVASQTSQAPADYWFMNQTPAAPLEPGQAQFTTGPAVVPGTQVDDSQIVASPEEEAIAERAKTLNEQSKQQSLHNIKTVLPLANQAAPVAPIAPVTTAPPAVAPAVVTEPPKPVTPPTDPAILNFVNRDDLNVATIARQAKRAQQSDDNEVVISLR